MALKRRWRWLLAAVVLLSLVGVVYGLFGPWEQIRRTGLTHDEYAARYDVLALPPTASDISLYVHKAWGNKAIMISFTVPDEQTFADWVTPRWRSPSAVGTVRITTFEGGELGVKEPKEHLTVTDCRRGEKHCTFVVFDRQTRRVYYNHRSGSTNEEG